MNPPTHAERAAAATALAAELATAEAPAFSVADAMPEIFAMLSRLTPASPEAYRAHTLANDILPMVGRWGFERRFLNETTDMHVRQQKVFNQVRDRMAGRGSVVALVGERGLGKTTIAAQCAISVAWRNHDEARKTDGTPPRIEHVIYKKCVKLIARFKPLYSDFGSIETEQLMDSLDFLCRNQEYLVIDEVHDCEDMKFRQRLLTDLIDRRYSACRDTILIANQTGPDFAASIGDSILSRLNEHGCIIECKWPSYRVQ